MTFDDLIGPGADVSRGLEKGIKGCAREELNLPRTATEPSADKEFCAVPMGWRDARGADEGHDSQLRSLLFKGSASRSRPGVKQSGPSLGICGGVEVVDYDVSGVDPEEAERAQ